MSDRLDFYLSNGYLVAPGVLGAATLQTLTSLVVSRTSGTCDLEGFVRHECAMEEFQLLAKLESSQLFALWTELLGADVVAILNRHNHITIDTGRGSKAAALHRDSLNWSRTYLTTMMLLAGNDHRAWPRLVPGSHRQSPRGPTNGGGYWLRQDVRHFLAEQAVAVPIKPGDVVFMDPMLFHAAGCGSVSMPRIALTLAVRAVDELAGNTPQHERLILGAQNYQGQAWFGSGAS
jgi:ectoine hydroxylase-related dioxygenase (phytanoyl-CoA dioxygenase family)